MIRKLRWLGVLGLALALAAVLTACSPSEFTLRLHFQKGDTFHIKMDTTQHMVQTVMGQDVKVDQQLVFEYTWEVTDVDAQGNATVKVTYDRVALSQEQNGQKRAYDSASGEEPPDFFKGVDLLVGKSFTAVLMPDGKVQSLSGLDEMLRAVADESGLSKEDADAFYESLLAGFGDEAMTEQFDSVVGQYPQQPLKVGSTWETDTTLQTLFPLTVHNTYTVQARKGNQVTLQLASTLKSDPEKVTTPNGSPFAVAYDLTGTQKGTMVVDLRTGLATTSNVEQHIEGNVLLMDPEKPGDEQSTLKMPVRMDTTVAISVRPGK